MYPSLELKNEFLEWDPSNTTYEEQENAMTDFRGNVIHSHLTATEPTLVVNSMSSTTIDAADLTHDYNFAYVLESHVNVSISDLTSNSSAGTIKSIAGRPVDHLTLANRWNIPVNRAKQTVTKTTQQGVRTCLTPSLSQRFPTNDSMFRYDCYPMHCFLTPRLLELFQSVEKNMPKRIVHILVGLELSLWQRKGTSMKLYIFYLSVMQFLPK